MCPLQSSAINSTRYHCRNFYGKVKCVETVLRIRHLLWCVFVAVKECVEHNILALGTICCHLCRTIAPPSFEWKSAIATAAASKRNHYKLNMNWIVYCLLKKFYVMGKKASLESKMHCDWNSAPHLPTIDQSWSDISYWNVFLSSFLYILWSGGSMLHWSQFIRS